ncbi:hypothetical protein [Sphingomonas sp. CFBP 13706]|uniref:hypothetical protein n=1 Tax=Sphingomonas sp. CFBP 13706 TaxID=2775314 RepID=UPI0017822FB3|nr:hypothetical protein [Sphingomonas sp. CFBP 13706]MBD8735712.1 hypothetical protein [Sphingomonas sp. CFBP 13706]
MAVILYRICENSPPSAEDFTSHVSSAVKRKIAQAKAALKRNPKDCDPSGLSVFLTEQRIRHACSVFRFAEGAYVYTIKVETDEGVIQPTRSDGHFTYWPLKSTKLKDRAQLAFGPVDRATVYVA